MLKVLAEEAAVRVDGKWRTLRAILVPSVGGRRVVYLDKDGIEVYHEPANKSQFADIVKQIKVEGEETE